jgi:hypothetical protein
MPAHTRPWRYRGKAAIEKAKSPDARCRKMAANGRPCIAYVQKYYLQCLKDGT